MEKIVSQCRRCLKHNGRVCNAFISPEFQWRNGKCFGYVDKPRDMEAMYIDMAEYAFCKSGKSFETEKMVKYWHNIATGKEKRYVEIQAEQER